MKKSIRLLFILLLCLAVVIAGYVLIGKHFSAQSEDENIVTLSAASIDGDIKSISWSIEGKEICSLQKGVKWVLSTDSSFPLSQKKANNLAEKLKKIDAMKLVITEPESLEEYGLASPTLKITVALDDGSKVIYSFGDKDMYSSGNYFVSSLENSVYLVDYRLSEEFPDDVYSLIDVEDLPELANFNKLEINSERKNISIIKTDESYVSVEGEKEKILPDEKAEEIHTAAGALKFNKCVNFKAEYDSYGLDKPAYTLKFTYTLEDGDSLEAIENELVLKIGSQNGEDYFACVDNSEMIYTINCSVIEPLLIDSVEQLTDETQKNENEN